MELPKGLEVDIIIFINLILIFITMSNKEIVEQLVKDGCTLVKNVTVKNVTVNVLENYTRLGFTIDKEVDGFVSKDDGVTYEPAKVNVIFASAYSIGALMKDSDEMAFAANHLMENPAGLAIILSRAKISIVQQKVKAKESYKNPFSESAEEVVFEHDTIINHVTSIELSEFGLKKLDKLADKMLGF